MNARPQKPVKVGVSRCLTGAAVRYDGTSAYTSLPHDRLDGLFEYIDVCPEMGIGLPAPRTPIRLVRDGNRIGVFALDGSEDFGPALQTFGEHFVASYPDICGFIFMHNSPSCGMRQVKCVATTGGPPQRTGQGAFARAVMATNPLLPCEDAGRLYQPILRENFVARVYVYAHWQAVANDLNVEALVVFHSTYKYLFKAQSPVCYRKACDLLAKLEEGRVNLNDAATGYAEFLMQGLGQLATRASHVDVLIELDLLVAKQLDPASRLEVSKAIEGYRLGDEPLLTPVSLLKRNLQAYPNEYTGLQAYLEPPPGRQDLGGLDR
ncbi:MAG: DUF523 and DUF1722 domain-containing protein [Pseudomonadota bacterium]|nr:DUF523 and DUF1722 domain-containing protein [Pseudomonadota bacterium]